MCLYLLICSGEAHAICVLENFLPPNEGFLAKFDVEIANNGDSYVVELDGKTAHFTFTRNHNNIILRTLADHEVRLRALSTYSYWKDEYDTLKTVKRRVNGFLF